MTLRPNVINRRGKRRHPPWPFPWGWTLIGYTEQKWQIHG